MAEKEKKTSSRFKNITEIGWMKKIFKEMNTTQKKRQAETNKGADLNREKDVH